MADALAIEPHASGPETVTGAGTVLDIGELRSCARLRLEVTSVTAGASLTCTLQSSSISTGGWRNIGDFTVAQAPLRTDKTFSELDRYVRLSWVITGASPSVTFRVRGFAHVLYATVNDVTRHALPAAAIVSISIEIKADCCLGATQEADSYLAGRYTLPLVLWDDVLTKHVAKIAGFEIMSRRGFQPTGFDELIVKGRDDAIAWLRGVAANKIYPPGLTDSDSEDVGTNDAFVIEVPATQWDAIGGLSSDPVYGDPRMRD